MEVNHGQGVEGIKMDQTVGGNNTCGQWMPNIKLLIKNVQSFYRGSCNKENNQTPVGNAGGRIIMIKSGQTNV